MEKSASNIIHKLRALNGNKANMAGVAALFMVCIAFLAVYGPTLHWLWKRWMMGVWYNAHGVAIPFISAYIIRRQLKAYQGPVDGNGSILGFLLLVPALFMHVVDTRLWSQILSAISIVPALIGLSMIFMGRSRTRAIIFPLLLLFFMIPIPSAATQPVVLVLRQLTAVGTEFMIRLLDIPVLRTGTELHFASGSINIADACSGFATLSATVMFTGAAIYLWPSGFARSAVLIAFAFPVALCANILRSTMLALLVVFYGLELLNTFLHPLSGYLAYFVAIGFQAGLLTLLRRNMK